MKGLILSAGSQPELAPITATTPVGTLPLGGRPLVAHQLERLHSLGIREVLVVLHHLPFPIERIIQAYAPDGMNVRVVLDRELAGTASALLQHAEFISETTLVLLGDIIERLDLEGALALHGERRALLTALMTPPEGDRRGGVGELAPDGRLLHFEEDPASWPLGAEMLVSAGVYLVDPRLLQEATLSGGIGADLLPGLTKRGMAVYGHRALGYWRDAGTPRGYVQAQLEHLQDGAFVHPLARVHADAKLVPPYWIGPGCRIAREAQVGPEAVLVHDVHLERGARLTSSVVLAGTRVGKATRFQDRLIWRHGSFDLRAAAPPFELAADTDELAPTLREPWSERVAQVQDSLLATVGLVLLSPLLLAIALLIALDDPGPPLYTQLRVGQDRRAFRLGRLRGRVFELYKFRTMCVDADGKLEALKSQNQYGEGAFFKLDHDPRVTRIGRFLRKTSLDELPQLLNVVLGDMRLVGNRPLPVYEAEALKEDWQRLRFASPAGITGLWQISGRSDLSEKERMVLDSYYSVTRSFWNDWVILAKTIPALLLRRGAR